MDPDDREDHTQLLGTGGFLTLALGGGLAEIWKPLLALAVMGLILFIISSQLFKRRGLMQVK